VPHNRESPIGFFWNGTSCDAKAKTASESPQARQAIRRHKEIVKAKKALLGSKRSIRSMGGVEMHELRRDDRFTPKHCGLYR